MKHKINRYISLNVPICYILTLFKARFLKYNAPIRTSIDLRNFRRSFAALFSQKICSTNHSTRHKMGPKSYFFHKRVRFPCVCPQNVSRLPTSYLVLKPCTNNNPMSTLMKESAPCVDS